MTEPRNVAGVARYDFDSIPSEPREDGGYVRYEDYARAISDGSPRWRDADRDPPADEQKVLACWKGSSCIEGMETLIYCADQDGSGDGWRDVHGDGRDPPTHWTLLEMPK